MSWVRLSRSRTGRPVSVAPSAAIAAYPCGCISLPPKPPPIRRHCTVTSWLCTAEHVRDDLLGLRRVLRAALDEDLAVLVDVRQRAVGLEVEVLLAGELELAAEHVGGSGEAVLDVAALHRAAAPPWKLSAAIASLDGDERRQRLVLDLDRGRAEPGGLQRLAEHPADRVAEVHDLGREQRLVVLDAGVVDAGHVVGGEHPDDPGHVERRSTSSRVTRAWACGDLHGVGVQAVVGPADQVVGVERRAGDVQRALSWGSPLRRPGSRGVRTGRSCGHLPPRRVGALQTRETA